MNTDRLLLLRNWIAAAVILSASGMAPLVFAQSVYRPPSDQIPVAVEIAPDGGTRVIMLQRNDENTPPVVGGCIPVVSITSRGERLPGAYFLNRSDLPATAISSRHPWFVTRDKSGEWRVEFLTAYRERQRPLPPEEWEQIPASELIPVVVDGLSCNCFDQVGSRAAGFSYDLSQLPEDIKTKAAAAIGRTTARIRRLLQAEPEALTIRIQLRWVPLGDGPLSSAAETTPEVVENINYTTVRGWLTNNADSVADTQESTLIGNLPPTGLLTAYYPDLNFRTVTGVHVPFYLHRKWNPLGGADKITVTEINFQKTWDFNPLDKIDGDKLDFENTLTHEALHALGFNTFVDLAKPESSTLTLWDIFRLQKLERPPVDPTSFSFEARMIRRGEDAVAVTILNSATAGVYRLSTGRVGGDGNFADHWLDYDLNPGGLWIGIMVPRLRNGYLIPAPEGGVAYYLNKPDIHAMDVMGWDIDVEQVNPHGTPPLSLAPANGADDVELRPILSWTGGGGAAGFAVTVFMGDIAQSEAVVFAATDITDSQIQIPPGVLAPASRYTWLVCAYNDMGIGFSEERTFTTLTPPNQGGNWQPGFEYPPPYGPGSGLNYYVQALYPLDDSTGPALYAAGLFWATAPATHTDGVARWNGTEWLPLGTGGGVTIQGYPGWAYSLTGLDSDGSGPAPRRLVAGGYFDHAGATAASSIAMWDGATQTWLPVGTGIPDGFIYALAEFDEDGAGPGGPMLFAGGTFDLTTPTGVAHNIARWNPTTQQWSPVGAGFNDAVYALCALDDGTGAHLYAGGTFDASDGNPMNHIARWNGAAWAPLLDGQANGVGSAVFCLAVFDDDGQGPRPPGLYAGGSFATAGATTVYGIARWNGTGWSALGSGMAGAYFTVPQVRALAVVDDDGPGPKPASLFAGGHFFFAGGQAVNHVAKWDGTRWAALGAGVGPISVEDIPMVLALAEFDDAGSRWPTALYAGGYFYLVGGQESTMIAEWVPVCPADFNGDGFLDPLDYNGFITAFESSDMSADFNADGFLDPLDYNGFITAFEAGC